jgi:hypothetical protein
MTDGHLGKCKECIKLDVKENRAKNSSYYKKYDKERSCLPERKATYKKTQIKWRSEHPERRSAGLAVTNALKAGKLFRLPCFICGNEKVEGHHPDYSQKLSVVWLCLEHHRQVHREHSNF